MPSSPLPFAPLAWTEALPPTHSAALARVDSVRPAAYARTRNHLDGAVTGLSPYLTHGVLTLPEVLARVLQREPLEVAHKLVYEFGWREFFRHAWGHEGQGILASLHPGVLPDSAYSPELPADIRQAQTGVPAIDEAVRTLYATGTLHNHARMWLASYVTHLRRVHWRAGADWLVAHLLDGDLASNHLSWQWVAATGSHKPYLFNAENVARFAPAAWHSTGSVIDRSYEDLERVARGDTAFKPDSRRAAAATAEPALLKAPPAGLGPVAPDASTIARLQGREVWLVHPWALRAAPADLPPDAVRLGVYLQEHHAAWPWPEARWHWVDRAMAEHTEQRWFTTAAGLAQALAGAAGVRSVADPHISRWLPALTRLDAAPALFPPVERHCTSFSQWWTRSTRGLQHAQELL